MNNSRLHSVVTKTLLGATLGIATGFLALAGTASPSFAAGAKPATKTATHVVVKTKTTAPKAKVVKHVAKHSVAKKATVKHSAKHVVKHSIAKKAVVKKATHTAVKPKVTVHSKTTIKKK